MGSKEGALGGQTPAPRSWAWGPGQEARRHVSPLSVHFYEAPFRVSFLVLGLQDSHRLACLQTHFMAASGHKGVHRHHLKHMGSDTESIRVGRQTDAIQRSCLTSSLPATRSLLPGSRHQLNIASVLKTMAPSATSTPNIYNAIGSVLALCVALTFTILKLFGPFFR